MAKETKSVKKRLTLADWRNSDALRTNLALALADPTLQQAIETLKNAYLPTAPPEIAVAGDGAASLMQTLALRHMHRAGFYGCLLALEQLTRAAKDQAPPLESWGLIPKTNNNYNRFLLLKN